MREVLDLVDLRTLGNRMPHELSGGQQQRVCPGQGAGATAGGALVGRAFFKPGPRAAAAGAQRHSGYSPSHGRHGHLRYPRPGRGPLYGRYPGDYEPGAASNRWAHPNTFFILRPPGSLPSSSDWRIFIPAWREEDQLVSDVGSMGMAAALSPAWVHQWEFRRAPGGDGPPRLPSLLSFPGGPGQDYRQGVPGGPSTCTGFPSLRAPPSVAFCPTRWNTPSVRRSP